MLQVLRLRNEYYPYSLGGATPQSTAVKAHVSHGVETCLHATKVLSRDRVSQFPPVEVLR
jgi:hypothetical protein